MKTPRQHDTIGVRIIRLLNPCFPKQQHPFNLETNGEKSYAQWQYDMGERTIQHYLKRFTKEELFRGKTVLDMGCGAAGKSLYYAGLGAKQVIGIDLVASYRAEAEQLARELGLSDRFTFLAGDVTKLSLPENYFDTIIMNDFMEHAADPQAVLETAYRLLRENGRIYINFPPYYHPFGAHLSDAINLPWVHLFFREKTLIAAYKELTEGLPDRAERLHLRFSVKEDGEETISYINRMTIRKFHALLRRLHLAPLYYREVPLRRPLAPFAKLPLLRECLVRMVVCVLEKNRGNSNIAE